MHSCSIASVIPTKRLIGKPHSNRSGKRPSSAGSMRSEEHTSELQSPCNLVCRLLLEKKKYMMNSINYLANLLTEFLNSMIQVHLSDSQLLKSNHLSSSIILLVVFYKIRSSISGITRL